MRDRVLLSPFRVVLSHVELAYLLSFFGVAPSIGVDRNPLEGLPAEQITIAQETASDALRARALLRFDAEGQPLLADDLLRVLGAYAGPQQMVTAYRYAADEALPLAFFGYVNDGDTVVHTRPGDLLHEFTLLSGASALIEALAAFCAGAKPAQLPRRQLSLPSQAIAAARAYADAGRALEVLQVLQEAGVPDPTAQSLADDLVTPSAVTTVTLLAQRDEGAPLRRDFIYWQSEPNNSALVIVERGSEVLIADGSEESISSIVNEMV